VETSAARGRLEFFAAVGAMTLLLLLLALGVWLRGAVFNPITQLGRPVVFIGLAMLAYGGAGWARKVLAFWSGLLSLTTAVVAINAGFEAALWALIAILSSVVAAYAAFVLFTSAAIDSFLADRAPKEAGLPPAA